MPGVEDPLPSMRNNNTDETESYRIEDIALTFPSGLEPTQCLTVCRDRVAEHEERFCLAQLQDSLVELRRTLITNHRLQISGQGRRANTHSCTVIGNIQERIDKFTRRYRAAHKALLQLDPSGNWQETYLELKESDNRGPSEEPEEEGVGDGSYTPSWIWLANPRGREPSGAAEPSENASDEEVNDAMRAEWTTSFARMERWAEEAELIQEEMRRVIEFLEWKSNDWSSKREARSALVTSDIQSRLGAYARKQAAVYRNLAVLFALLWRPVLASNNLDHSWAVVYLQWHRVLFADTSTSRNLGSLENQTASSTEYDQHDTLPTPHIHNPPGAHDVDEGMLLDAANYDSLTDTTSSEVDESEGKRDDDNDDDDSDNDDYDDFEFDFT